MNSRVHVAVDAGDAARLDADVIALRFGGTLTGAAAQIAAAIGVTADDLRRVIPARGDLHVTPSKGRIAARHAAFLHTAPVDSFTFDDIRDFAANVIRGLRVRLPGATHVGFTLPGVGFEMDYERAMASEIEGCEAPIRSGDCPQGLDRISIVNREISLARLQAALDDVLPEGFIAMPAPAAAPRAPVLERFDVFISFKSEDSDYAQQVFEYLTANGLRVFFSRESLPRLGSDEYHRQIDTAIEHTRHMVVVTSSREHAMSRWVQYEWYLFLGELNAGRKTGNLISVAAGGVNIDDLPIALRNREVVRLGAQELPRLLDYFRSDPDRYERAVPAPPRPSRLRALGGLLVAPDAAMANASWKDAQRQAAGLTIEGRGGWRLPTLAELRLIRQASVVPPRFCYWSAEEADRAEAFYMHFDDGHVGRGPKSFSNGLSAVFVTPRE